VKREQNDSGRERASGATSGERRATRDVTVSDGGLRDVEGRRRVVIERVQPAVDAGRYPIKRVVSETVLVEADIFADGHDELAAVLRYRHERQPTWHEIPMALHENDRWRARFIVEDIGRYVYQVTAWIDRFGSWQRDMRKRIAAAQDVAVELLIGRNMIDQAARAAQGPDRARLETIASRLAQEPPAGAHELVLSRELTDLMQTYADRRWAAVSDRDFWVVVDRPKARSSAWYEMFPRSCSNDPGKHGTFRDCEARLPYVAQMGFDVLYLPPIHPIGRTFRKGRNNRPEGEDGAVGSPWAIGSHAGGHIAIHPDLGTLDDFRHLVSAARSAGIEIALDLAFQCAPDHPYVAKHPEWFVMRPDGTIQYAENPPKKYQDIYPLNFETDAWPDLWLELKRVVLYWVEQGVRIFRVDNPHTKPFAFWEWLINEIKREHPDILFLAEAFTRPKVMYRLAKIGFTQSYTYFAWRLTKSELVQYFTELTKTDVREFFRPNLWPNTPDILTEQLQYGGRPAFLSRFILAATLGANYGIYGPAFELMEHWPAKPGSEEYLDSEKYEIRTWDLERPDSLRDIIARVNRIRQDNPALQHDATLTFHSVDNEYLLAYSKTSTDRENVVLVIVNLSEHHTHSGWVHLDLAALGLEPDQPFQAADLLTHAHYLWQGPDNYIQVDPHAMPAHIFVIRRRLRRERDFDYFL
jgi:starch synthase (maltosyl-transferring)